MLKFILIILDGFGLRDNNHGNAIAQAETPMIDKMLDKCPISSIETAGKYVGLPDGIMGNSEVGHMNIGAGRIVKQDLVRINESIKSDSLKNNSVLINLFKYVISNQSTLHIIGLVSDGGVHSHLEHFKYILKIANELNVKNVVLHAITDGRDTSPTSGIKFINQLQNYCENFDGYRVGSICGRYYAMDRDSRWDRVEKAYRMYIFGEGKKYSDINQAINSSYEAGITDEFILPSIIGDTSLIEKNDGVLLMNFRADRMRQIVSALSDNSFSHFSVNKFDIMLTSMTKYQDSFSHPVLFEREEITNIFPEILANHGYNQLRIAETEKYAHVTYFFNGGKEKTFTGEDRCLVPSPKVATYDMQPEMSAYEITKEVISAISGDKYEAIVVNFANPDMVGHTGNMKAAIKAIETVDKCIFDIRQHVKSKNAALFLTADHGNLEMMIDPLTNQIHTAHTTLPVPLILDCVSNNYKLLSKGKLADIAPTILDYLNIRQPDEMTGNSLLINAESNL